MSRFTALFLAFLFALIPPAFSAEEPAPTRNVSPQADDIDPATGLARTTVVRPLRDFAPVTSEGRRTAAPPVTSEGRQPVVEPATEKRRHIALVLPRLSATLGPVAEAMRQGFLAAVEAAGREAPPVTFTPVENEAQALLDACRTAQERGAIIVVGGMTRDGATALARSDCPRLPVLALNEPQGSAARGPDSGPGDLPANLFHVSLSLEQDARQIALQAVNDGWHSAIVITSPSPLARRVQEAFEREWTRAAGEVRRVSYGGNPDDAPQLRERIANTRGDMVFLALDQPEARAVRPYVSGALPVYATAMSVDPRADPAVNVDLQGVRYLDMPWFVQPDHAAVMVYPVPKNLPAEQERLYALGIDAFRLALLLLRDPRETLTLDGVTGRITLAPGNTFVRALVPAEVDGGRVAAVKAP
jgi:outer membrane PBP1 activator LpoA protein